MRENALSNPDWYPEWRHDVVHELQEKNARLTAEFRLGSWPRYDYDVDAGTLIFSDNAVAKVIAEIQIVGTTSTKAGDWLWAWANSHWPAERVTGSQLVRAFGQKHGIGELTQESVRDDDLNAIGWEFTSVMARVTDALGAYRPPRADGGGLFLIYHSMAWTS